MTKGIIYILTNEAMPGYVKIGKTTTSVEDRMKGLDSTGIPLPFECHFAAQVDEMDMIEKHLHDAFSDQRVRQRREFFEISPERVRSALLIAGGIDVTPKGEVVEDEEDIKALNKARTMRSRFKFRMVNLKPGTTLTHARDENAICTIIDGSRVEFEGKETSLSTSALIVLHRLGYKWSKVSGPVFWKYNDETLSELRHRLEIADNNDE